MAAPRRRRVDRQRGAIEAEQILSPPEPPVTPARRRRARSTPPEPVLSPVAPVQPVLVAPAPEAEPSRTREADTLLPNVTGQHRGLVELAIAVWSNGSSAQDFDDLLTKFREFLVVRVVMRRSFPRVNFGDFTEAIQVLSRCGAALERYGQGDEDVRTRGIAH